jgi:hypothetical protein
MKPKPFSELNHFTVPEAILISIRGNFRAALCCPVLPVITPPGELEEPGIQEKRKCTRRRK